MSKQLTDNLEFVLKKLKILSKDRKVVLSHYETFELVEELREKIQESLEIIKNKINISFMNMINFEKH